MKKKKKHFFLNLMSDRQSVDCNGFFFHKAKMVTTAVAGFLSLKNALQNETKINKFKKIR